VTAHHILVCFVHFIRCFVIRYPYHFNCRIVTCHCTCSIIPDLSNNYDMIRNSKSCHSRVMVITLPLPSVHLEPVMSTDIPHRRPKALFPFLKMIGHVPGVTMEQDDRTTLRIFRIMHIVDAFLCHLFSSLDCHWLSVALHRLWRNEKRHLVTDISISNEVPLCTFLRLLLRNYLFSFSPSTIRPHSLSFFGFLHISPAKSVLRHQVRCTFISYPKTARKVGFH